MRKRLEQIAAIAVVSAGVLILTSCAHNIEVPTTFAATVTVIGEADQVSVDSGECTIGEIRVAPNDQINIFGGSGAASTRSTLEAESIDQNPDGTGTCTFTAHFDAVPANQKSYDIYVNNTFAQQSFTSDELKSGATYRLR
ncbi:hypothetical protein B2J88_49920 [Rhodococcus sp. SRB_17]|uniref:hypothetical protein n=1 Tax=Rhodococcus sp. OK302 TaxID=1882769 RepID=UPI000B945527|nr:hypothetical protein [Rhodococcus sp. OK302]NMM92272.1 hypothetical protein [Rhodococcus sp. SRB_17]OYD61269.1 hypothetical protein BDB13_6236 [Rhodococcus sp. OK302]